MSQTPDPTVAMFGKLFEKVDDLAKLIAGRPPRQHLNHPLVPGATWRVDCECGFARDSAAMTAEMALDEVGRDHDPRHREHLTVDAVDYSEHPLYKGRSTKVRRVIRALVVRVLALAPPPLGQTRPGPG